ncbi:MAG: PfkB family carbohydrate kinase [Candidatus Neomarinimicrobiota bacterium]
MKENSILIVGSNALDTIVTPQGRRNDVIGGSTTYALIAAGKTCPVNIVGVVGTDFPAAGKEIYKKYASSLEDLKFMEGNTFRWGGSYHGNWDDRDTLFTELGVFADFNPVLSPVNQNCSHIFLANIHPALQNNVINQAKQPQAIVIDTMNLWINTARAELKEVLSKSNILLINESEAALLSNENDIKTTVKILQSLGPEIVVIKKGRNGAMLFQGTDSIKIGAYPVKNVVDPTGAGDTFGGGFVSALTRNESFIDALALGSAWASVCVEGFGPECLLKVSESEIEKRIQFLKETVIS